MVVSSEGDGMNERQKRTPDGTLYDHDKRFFYFSRVTSRNSTLLNNFPFVPSSQIRQRFYTMCSVIVEYYDYGHYDGRPRFEASNGDIETARGYGKCLIQPDQDNSLVYGLIVNCQYNPNISYVPITKFHKAVN